MCGIAGFLTPGHNVAEAVLESMLSAIAHRGPDDAGCWHDLSAGVSLGHRRLSILDLSPAGHQPMVSACGRFVIVFNGEIYNWKIIRSDLESEGLAPAWRGHSDTEVLLAGIAGWGLSETLYRSRGMFALAVWDREERTLRLARDRIGEKPLYFGTHGGEFFFGSELKALRASGRWPLTVDPNAVALQIRYGYVPSPFSIYRNVQKLPPGTMLRVSADGRPGEPEAWWSFKDRVEASKRSPFTGSFDEAMLLVDSALRSSVAEQMVSDVPLGALLSGGVDSSLIAALMQSAGSRPARTFCIGFSDASYNEAVHAKAVASHLGTSHTEMIVEPRDALEVIPRLPDLYDEPFGDSSQIPTALVCKLARQHVTVALSGDAGDELFGGYNRYFWAERLWKNLSKVPPGMRRAMGSSIASVSAARWNAVFKMAGAVLPSSVAVSNPGDKLHKFSEIAAAVSSQELYWMLVSQWRGDLPLTAIKREPGTLVSLPGLWPDFLNLTEQMMYVDTLTYLPDDILVKVDRASMASSLEMRVPFLDARVVDLAWSLPMSYKASGCRGKIILRELLKKYLPGELIERPKQGFALPIAEWLRGPLREWAEALLCPEALATDGVLDAGAVRAMWSKHLLGHNMQYGLWNVLMFQAWRQRWR